MLIGAIGGLIVGAIVTWEVAAIRYTRVLRASTEMLERAERRLRELGQDVPSVDRRRAGR